MPKDSATATPVVEDKEESPAELRRKLQAARKELAENLSRKKAIDRNLAHLESSIYAFETSYLSPIDLSASPASTLPPTSFGNIVKGYDAYLKATSAASGSGSNSDRKRARMMSSTGIVEVKEEDRLFSRSSKTYERSRELKQLEEASAASSGEEPSESPQQSKKKKKS